MAPFLRPTNLCQEGQKPLEFLHNFSAFADGWALIQGCLRNKQVRAIHHSIAFLCHPYPFNLWHICLKLFSLKGHEADNGTIKETIWRPLVQKWNATKRVREIETGRERETEREIVSVWVRATNFRDAVFQMEIPRRLKTAFKDLRVIAKTWVVWHS